MTRIWIALAAFLVTISIVWVVSSPDTPPIIPDQPALPAGQAGQIYLQSGTKLNGSPKASTTLTPTETQTPSPSPTAIILTPQTLITPSPTPTPIPSRTPIPSPTTTILTTPPPTPTSTPTPTPTSTPTPSSTPTPVSSAMRLTLVALTPSVPQKDTATIKIQTEAGAQCTVEATLPSKKVSTSKDLDQKTADQDGVAMWSWYITWNTQPGTVTLKFSCAKDGATATGQTTMEIVASQ